MTTSEQVRILSKICTRNEAGRHFTEVYGAEAIGELESDGLLEINRPIHDTGISYSQDHWSVEVTDEGVALVEANPEDWDC